MQEGITQEPARSKTEQELEQRAVPGRVGFHWDEKEHEEWGCRDQHCGPQCLVKRVRRQSRSFPTIQSQSLFPTSPGDSRRPRG